MVSIAESFNYRIFERKRRMGEALHESSPCMPHLSVEQQKRKPSCLHAKQGKSAFFQNKKTNRESGVWLKISKRTTPVFCHTQDFLLLLWPIQKNLFRRKIERNTKKLQTFFGNSYLFFFQQFLFTDLSAAGLPAELKHITQRRKRKQP